jgi:MFS family permease
MDDDMYTNSMLRDNMAVTHKIEPPVLEGLGLLAPSERTPLLNKPIQHEHPIVDDSKSCDEAAQREEEDIFVIEEPSTGKLVLIMGTAWLGILLGALDSTIIATLSAPISSEFDSLSLLSWLATAYLISNAACQPIAGRLTDIFGRRTGLIVSNLFFAAGNLLCGLAINQHTMILGRVVAGIGGGGLISIATFLTSDLTPLRKRGIMQGIANLWYGAGAMLGAVVGGALKEHTALGWRLAFLIQVPPSLLLIPAIWMLVRVPCKASDKSYVSRIDFLGVFFTTTFLVLLLLGLNAGGNSVPWTHPLPLTTLPLSILAFIGFIWWESKAKQPIIPVRLLRDRTVLSACFASLFISMILMTTTFYLPLYFQVLGNSTTTAGLKLLPSPLGGSIGALATGYAMAKTGRYKRLGVLGALSLVIGTSLFAFQDEDSPVYLTCVALFFVGSGFSVVLTTTTVACLAAVDHSQQALVTSAICEYTVLSLRAAVHFNANTFHSPRQKCRRHNRYYPGFCSLPEHPEGRTVGSIWRASHRSGRNPSYSERLGGAEETSWGLGGGCYCVVYGVFQARVGDDGFLGFPGSRLHRDAEAIQAACDDR